LAVGLGGAVVTGQQAAPQTVESGFGRGAYRLGPGVEAPVTIRSREVAFAPADLQAGADALIAIEAVVQANGTVGETRLARSEGVSDTLTTAALAAARQHLFRPGRVGGRAVAVIVTIEFQFRLQYVASTRVVAPDSADDLFRRAYQITMGVTAPEPTRVVDPEYTDEARRRQIRGEVYLDAVVMPDGSVGATRVVRSLDAQYGLDAQAEAAARQWRFRPGRLNGQPVPVRVALILTFRPR
jgi:TonB family protein